MFVKQDVDCDFKVQKRGYLIRIEFENLHMNNGNLWLASYSSQITCFCNATQNMSIF